MRLLPIFVLPIALLAGCAGNALDYTKPKPAIIAPELERYALAPAQQTCLANTLGKSLTVLQLRKLARLAGVGPPKGSSATKLSVRDFMWRAAQVQDLKVPLEVARAADSCNVTAPAPTMAVASASPNPAATQPALSAVAAGSAAQVAAGRPATWLNLGAAPTGQAIAVDASSIEAAESYRTAWFRVTDPGAAAPNPSSYLLRVDCGARTINSMALRKYGTTGAVAEERSYGTTGEGALKVEGGTIMEIAYLALCT